MSPGKFKLPHLFALAAVAALAACSPPTESEREYYRKREAERMEKETLKMAVTESAKDTEILTLVKESAAVDGVGKTEAWVDRQMRGVLGQVIFPRWEISRRGSTKYEVRFMYTTVDERSYMSKRGWRWDVDVMLKMVGPPREVLPHDAAPRVRASESEQQKRRIREAEARLE
jgi:hypothetical protein